MIKVVDSNFDREVWNSVAQHPLQSWEWGEARKKMGIEVLRVGEFDKNKLKKVFQITFHNIPRTKYKAGYLPRSQSPTKELLDFLYNYCKKNNIIFVKLEPYEERNAKYEMRNTNLVSSSHPLFPKWTIILDLKKTEENLLKSMKPKTRYNIRLAQRKGVEVREMSDNKGFEIFTKLYFETTKRQKYLGHDYNYHETVWETLKNKIVHILVAFYKNQPLAAYELFIFKNRAYYPYGGSSLEYKNLMATNLLMWEALLFAEKKGAETFDMWGASSPSSATNDPYAGFTRFKEGYGGNFVEFIGSYDLVIYPALYKIYSLSYKIREKYLVGLI